jgi:hypothetical protein
VVFSIIDPVEQNNVIAMTKVWDQQLAARLQGEFEEMWGSAKKLPSHKKTKQLQSSGSSNLKSHAT